MTCRLPGGAEGIRTSDFRGTGAHALDGAAAASTQVFGRNAQIAVIARRRSNRPGLSRQAGRKRRSARVPPGGPCTKARRALLMCYCTPLPSSEGSPARRCSRHRSALAWA
jgi:hypothetical protein